MHFKRRNNRAALYRSNWIPKGVKGNTHGYSHQSFIASLPLDAISISDTIRNLLSDEEISWVEEHICQPARQAAEHVRIEREEREADPNWRLREAARLIGEAAARVHHRPATATNIDVVSQAITELRTSVHQPNAESDIQGPDPMEAVLTALHEAVMALNSGAYGDAPAEGARSTAVYQSWLRIERMVNQKGPDTLLGALQSRKYVKQVKKSALKQP